MRGILNLPIVHLVLKIIDKMFSRTMDGFGCVGV